MQQIELKKLVPDLMALAKLAGDAIMSIYTHGNKDTRLKSDQSPVTIADIAAHEIIENGLKQLLPECPIVSEEDADSHAYRLTNSRFWLIDPLDGTKEFLAGNGEFTVNIALIEHGESVMGIVYAPALDLLYWGGKNLGSHHVTPKESIKIQVGSGFSGNTCRVVASKNHLNQETKTLIDSLGLVTLVQAGSSLKFCLVAEGAADIYPRLAPTCEWDTAAAQAVLEGAGGVVVNLNGEPLRYGKPDILNPSFIATRALELIPV